MPVGNDVVDLRDPDNQPAVLHPRFDRRVFGAEERDLLADAPDGGARHRLRWTLWAAKESALKYLRQISPGLPFHPREFVVHVDSPTDGRVVHRGTELAVELDVTPARVHAVTVPSTGSGDAPAGPVASARVARTPTHGDASLDVRRLAAREIGRLLRIRPATVEIDGTSRSAPSAYHEGERLPVELSLSHDGSWIACAVQPVPVRRKA